MNDYPAAHSMDTEWFAVDKSGHVAYLYSGEHAAVPEDVHNFFNAPNYCGYSDVVNRILDLPENKLKKIKFNAEGLFVDNKHSECPYLLELNSRKGFKVLSSLNINFIELNVPKRIVVFLRYSYDDGSSKKREQAVKELHNRKYCKNCLILKEPGVFSDGFLARFGFYEYDAGEYSALDIYDQVKTPVWPLRIQDIGEELINKECRGEFKNIKFANLPRFQPCEYGYHRKYSGEDWTPLSAWDSQSWYAIDSNGYIANFIGEGYTGFYEFEPEKIIQDLMEMHCSLQYNFNGQCSYQNDEWYYLESFIIKVTSEEALTILKKNGTNYMVLPIHNTTAIYIPYSESDILDELHNKNYCCGCLKVNSFLNNRSMGIYEYTLKKELDKDHMTYINTDTYEKTYTPIKPCKTDSILPEIYKAAKNNILPNIKFKVNKTITISNKELRELGIVTRYSPTT